MADAKVHSHHEPGKEEEPRLNRTFVRAGVLSQSIVNVEIPEFKQLRELWGDKSYSPNWFHIGD